MRLYSFRDLLSLKVLSQLRNETRVSMDHLREVKRDLEHLGEPVEIIRPARQYFDPARMSSAQRVFRRTFNERLITNRYKAGRPSRTAQKRKENRALQMLAALFSVLCLAQSQSAMAAENPILEAARQAEAQLDARVGLAIYDTQDGASWLYNADERFPMASTFKVLACGALLARSDAGDADTHRRVPIVEAELVAYSPVTEGWVGREATLEALCAATMRTSDNTAANIVLDALGGPDAVTAFMRSIGDNVTRLDRKETELNEATPGDPRDTTSPAAMADSLQKLVLGEALSPSSRETLTEWLEGNEVGGPLLRAGIPNHWRIGDRTGAGGHGSRGIAAIIWPPKRDPLIAVIYITQTDASMKQRNEAIATIGQALAETVSASAER